MNIIFLFSENKRFFVLLFPLLFILLRPVLATAANNETYRIKKIEGDLVTLVVSKGASVKKGDVVFVQKTIVVSEKQVLVSMAKAIVEDIANGECVIRVVKLGRGFGLKNGDVLFLRSSANGRQPSAGRIKKNRKINEKISLPKLFALARKAEKSGEFTTAIKYYNSILARVSNDPMALSRLKFCQKMLAKNKKKNIREKKREKLVPNGNYLVKMAKQCVDSGEGALAEQYLNEILRKIPDDLDAVRIMVIAKSEQKDKIAAVNFLERFFKLPDVSDSDLLLTVKQLKTRASHGIALCCIQHILKFHHSDGVLGILDSMIGEQYENILGMKFVWIPPGTFQMGSVNGKVDEQPVHSVALSKGFYMLESEITERMWREIMGNSGQFSSSSDSLDLPVTRVSWDEIQEFLVKINKQTGEYYRLPTESEWEYACRAGTKTAFFFSDDESLLYQYGNFCDKLCSRIWKNTRISDGYATAAPVKSYLPNAFGLYDMSGNVWEWCSDWYSANYYRQSPYLNPHGPDSGENKVLRGGGWGNKAIDCRSAKRGYSKPNKSYSYAGFRIVREKRN